MPGTLDAIDFANMLPQAFLDELSIPLPSCISPVPEHQACVSAPHFSPSAPGDSEPVFHSGFVDTAAPVHQPFNDCDAAELLDAALHAAIAAIQAPAALPQNTPPPHPSADMSDCLRSDSPGVDCESDDRFQFNSQRDTGSTGSMRERDDADLWSNSSSSTDFGSNSPAACAAADAQGMAEATVVAAPRSGAGPSRAALSNDEEAKRADRRRRNREASSRSYYRRKRQTEALAKDLRDSRAKAARLFKVETALRRENMRLKRIQWERLITTRLDMTLDLLPGELANECTENYAL